MYLFMIKVYHTVLMLNNKNDINTDFLNLYHQQLLNLVDQLYYDIYILQINILKPTIMYHSNQYLLNPLQDDNLVHYYSFIKKPQIQQRNSNSINEKKHKTYMTVSHHDLNQTVPFNRSAYQSRRLKQTQEYVKNPQYTFKQSPSPIFQNRSSLRDSARAKKSFDEIELKSVSVLSSPKEQTTGVIYKQIIQIVQNQNRNLKEHNKFLLNQYKRMQIENSDLKQKMQRLSIDELEDYKIENQKLKQMNEVYKKQIQELKYVLLEQMVSLHQKFNLIIAQDQKSNQKIHQFAEQLKNSQTLTLNSAYFKNDRLKIDLEKHNYNQSAKKSKLQEMIFSEIFSQDQYNRCKEDQPRETFQTIPKYNDSSSSNNFDLESMSSPPQTTFSGQLRLSNDKQRIQYCKEQLRNNLQKIMQHRVHNK